MAGEVGKIWSEYTRFVEERGRPRTAQKLYLRALVGEGEDGPSVKDGGDRALLWREFLRMMQTLRKNPRLTLEDLKRAVEQERVAQVGTAGEQSVVTSVQEEESKQCVEGRPAKRSRWDQKSTAPSADIQTVSASSIDTAAGVLMATSKNMPNEIEAAWHARDGGSLPSPPEPPLFTASPPKLGDPSGKDLIGNDAALKLLRMLTAKTHDGKSVGSALLELCHACWMMTALKEEETSKAYECLEKKIVRFLFCTDKRCIIIRIRNSSAFFFLTSPITTEY